MLHVAEQAQSNSSIGNCAWQLDEIETQIITSVIDATSLPDEATGRLWLASVIHESPCKTWMETSQMSRPGLVGAIQHALRLFQEVGANPDTLKDTAMKLPVQGKKRLERMASMMDWWSAFKETHNIMDVFEAHWFAASSINNGAELPKFLRETTSITLRYCLDLPPARLALWEAIAKRLLESCSITIELPYAPGETIYAQRISRMLNDFERFAQSSQLNIHPIPVSLDANGCGASLATRLYEPRNAAEPLEGVAAFELSSRTEQLAIVSCTLRQWLDEGIAPHRIAVCCPTLNKEADFWATALAQEGIPIEQPRYPALLNSHFLRWLCELTKLTQSQWTATTLFTVLSSDFARTLFEQAITRSVLRKTLSTLPSSHHLELPTVVKSLEAMESQSALSCASAVNKLHLLLDPFSEQMSLHDFVDRFRSLVRALKVKQSLERPHIHPESLRTMIHASDPLNRNLARALGQDELAFESLDRILDRFSLVAKSLDAKHPSKHWFEQLFSELQDASLSLLSVHGNSIAMLSLSMLAARQFDAVVFCDLSEESFAALAKDNPLLPYSDLWHMHQDIVSHSKAGFDCSSRATADSVLHDTTLERAASDFLLGLFSATKKLCLCYCQTDSAGRPLSASMFFKDSAEAIGITSATECLRNARGKTLSRRMLGATLHKGALPETSHDLLLSAKQRIGIEHSRFVHALSFGKVAQNSYTGILSAESLSLEDPIGSENSPLSASQLERAFRCPFQDFAARRLRLIDDRDVEFDLEAKDQGTLAHLCFEDAMSSIIQKGVSQFHEKHRKMALELASNAIEARIQQQATATSLHPSIFATIAHRIASQLLGLIDDLYRSDDGYHAIHPEQTFGFKDGWPALQISDPQSETSYFVRGKIDLVEEGRGGVRVSDLKRAKTGSLRAQLQPAKFGSQHLQLSLYAAATTQTKMLSNEKIDARFLSLGDQKALPSIRVLAKTSSAWKKSTTAIEDLLHVSNPDRHLTVLGERVVDLATQMRSGKHVLRPIAEACGFCDFSPLCRIPEKPAEEAEDD
ncbi:MAG: PD-(D/E)XK nuclease family protein [Myxococcales bacterium]|nr:MAG: PD-(D/E)XK nuclease family protein [Myxococcales bacterium]